MRASLKPYFRPGFLFERQEEKVDPAAAVSLLCHGQIQSKCREIIRKSFCIRIALQIKQLQVGAAVAAGLGLNPVRILLEGEISDVRSRTAIGARQARNIPVRGAKRAA